MACTDTAADAASTGCHRSWTVVTDVQWLASRSATVNFTFSTDERSREPADQISNQTLSESKKVSMLPENSVVHYPAETQCFGWFK